MSQTRNKFGAKKTEYNGQLYDSKKEAKYAEYLDDRKRKGEIKDWLRQERIDAVINGKKVFYLQVDFTVITNTGLREYVDVKGYKKGSHYQYFRIKKKVLEALLGIQIEEA